MFSTKTRLSFLEVGIVEDECEIVGCESSMFTDFVIEDMVKQEDKNKDVCEHTKENIENVYADANGVESHVEGVHNLSLGTSILVDDKRQKFIQTLLQFKVRWNNPWIDITVSKHYVIDLKDGKDMNTITFDEIDVDVGKIVLYKPYPFDLNLCHKSREKTTELMNDSMTDIVYPSNDKGVLISSLFAVCGVTMVNHDVIGLTQVLSLQNIDLVEEFRYKVPLRPFPIKIPPWRDKQLADPVLIVDENSRSSSFEVKETDVGGFSVLIAVHDS